MHSSPMQPLVLLRCWFSLPDHHVRNTSTSQSLTGLAANPAIVTPIAVIRIGIAR